MKKKKLFIALLASLCISAGAAGLVACSNDKGEAYDPALYAAYQRYAESTENAKSYEEWVADILDKLASGGAQGTQGERGPQGDDGERGDDGIDGIDGIDGVGIEDISYWYDENDKPYLQFTMTNGRIIRLAMDGSDRMETSAFTINAVDQNGNPVADAYFNVGYVINYVNTFLKKDGSITSEQNLSYAVKTNSHGVATFYTFPSQNVATYSVFAADPLSINSEGDIDPVPKGYSLSFGVDELLGMQKMSAEFTKVDEYNYSITVRFTTNNSWSSLYDSSDDLKYSRYIDTANNNNILVDYTPYVKRANNGMYNYFTFAPYKTPNVDSGLDEAMALAKEAASGLYRISWKASNRNANVDLYLYSFVGGNYFARNSDGSPADSLVTMHSGNVPTDEKVLNELFRQSGLADYGSWYLQYARTYTGGNYVDVELSVEDATKPVSLGFVADMNCDVTISVERLGDVVPWTTVENTVQMPSNATPAANQVGRVTEVPLTSTTVKGNDGNYHVGTADGPVIYVQLKRGTRVNDLSMEFLAEYTVQDATQSVVRRTFVYDTVDEDAHVRTRTDYTEVVKGYAALTNEDGLYPVNDVLKAVLEGYCQSMLGSQNYTEYWVAACYYYGPESDGTEANPYDLVTGDNTVKLTGGSAYVSFKADSSNMYGFSATNGTVVGVTGIDVNGVTYVEIARNTAVLFRVTGTGDTVTVKVTEIAENHYLRYYESVMESGDTTIINEHGTQANPINVSNGIAVPLRVTVNHYTYNNAVYIKLVAPLYMDGWYTISVYGSTTATIVDGDGESVIGKAIYLTNATPLILAIDDVDDGDFIIWISSTTAPANALNSAPVVDLSDYDLIDNLPGNKS